MLPFLRPGKLGFEKNEEEEPMQNVKSANVGASLCSCGAGIVVGATSYTTSEDGVITIKAINVAPDHGAAAVAVIELREREGGGFRMKTSTLTITSGVGETTEEKEEEFDKLPENIKQALDDAAADSSSPLTV